MMKIARASDTIFCLAESAPDDFPWGDAMSWSPPYEPGDDPGVEDDHSYLVDRGWTPIPNHSSRGYYVKTVAPNTGVALRQVPATGRWQLHLPTGPTYHDWADEANQHLETHRVLHPEHYH